MAKFNCVDCGKEFIRRGEPQLRCADCRPLHRKRMEATERALDAESLRIKRRGLGMRPVSKSQPRLPSIGGQTRHGQKFAR